MTDTICAISTSLGVGAISIIRVSGNDAISIVNSIFKGKDLTKVDSHTINYGHIIYNNEIIDEVLVSVMKSPKTFTLEDIVEINSHGGISTTNKVLEVLLLSGARLAEPGEFTKRAFLNGRIDLVNAEAVGDLITAKTEKSRKLAINQLTGNVSNLIKDIRREILDIIANMEVNIDYPEYEEGEDYTISRFLEKINQVKDKLDKLVSNSMDGKIVKTGINVALLGKPNVGKSSILNKFLNEEKAIVTNIPGTTRDIVEGNFTLRGIEINIIDTAGIRETSDIVEKLGVEKSLKISENADLIIYVLDGNNEITEEDSDMLKRIKDKKVIIFINKSDMNININNDMLKDYDSIIGNTVDDNGLDGLKEEVVKLFNIDELEQSDYTFLSNARDISLIKKSSEILNSIPLNIYNLPIDVFIIDLRRIYDLLGEVIGETYKDDLLDEMFSKFCLGK